MTQPDTARSARRRGVTRHSVVLAQHRRAQCRVDTTWWPYIPTIKPVACHHSGSALKPITNKSASTYKSGWRRGRVLNHHLPLPRLGCVESKRVSRSTWGQRGDNSRGACDGVGHRHQDLETCVVVHGCCSTRRLHIRANAEGDGWGIAHVDVEVIGWSYLSKRKWHPRRLEHRAGDLAYHQRVWITTLVVATLLRGEVPPWQGHPWVGGAPDL